ncbi:MAG TPA: hypothetical protein VF698_11095 [Thermoanaerobaculia bacterium]
MNRRVLLVAVVTAVLYGWFLHALLAARGYDVSRFVVAGGPGVDAKAVPPGLTVIPNIGGYDGVAFYRLALDPFTTRQAAYGITLDNPAYRQQRIGYSLLVWLLTGGGQPRLVPYALVAVNYFALIAIGALGAILAGKFGAHPLWGLAFALYPGFLMPLSRDTTEIVACAFTIAALVAMRTNRWTLAGAMLACAALTRETTLILVAALIAAYVIRRDDVRPRAFAIPLAAFGAWQLVLFAIWEVLPVRAGKPGFVAPLSEYLRVLAESFPRRIHLQRLYFYECVFLALVTALALIAPFHRKRAPLAWRFAFAGQLALAAILPNAMWAEDFVFMRILGDFALLSTALILPTNNTLRATVLLASAALWFYLGTHIIELA